MEVVAIKIIKGYYAGRYYAGSRKNPAVTLLGAQLYKSRKTAEKTMETSVNFHFKKDEVTIVNVELNEKGS